MTSQWDGLPVGAVATADVAAAGAHAELVAVPVYQDAAPLDATASAAAGTVGRLHVSGAEGTAALTQLDDTAVLLLGCGPRSTLGVAQVRRWAARVVAEASAFASVVLFAPHLADPLAAAQAVAEGVTDGAYESSRLADARDAALRTVLLADPGRASDGIAAALERGTVVAASAAWARALIDRPANLLDPTALDDEARALAARFGLEHAGLDEHALRAGGFGGLLAVGGGSQRPPRLIEVRHRGAGPRIALVGKGITFDSGGLMLKSKAHMASMRSDMAGAATMLAAVQAAARLRLDVDVRVLVAAAENMPSGSAMRAGDVIRHRGGIESEVLDTDAEGRLVLADAIAYAAEERPDVIVDAATLTYAVMQALGDEISGILGTDDAVVESMIAAGADVGEPMWRLPIWDGYRKNILSPSGRVRNDGGDQADAIHSALFLREFTAGLPWAHLDIAGTAYVETEHDPRRHGATGTTVRTLVAWLAARAASG